MLCYAMNWWSYSKKQEDRRRPSSTSSPTTRRCRIPRNGAHPSTHINTNQPNSTAYSSLCMKKKRKSQQHKININSLLLSGDRDEECQSNWRNRWYKKNKTQHLLLNIYTIDNKPKADSLLLNVLTILTRTCIYM